MNNSLPPSQGGSESVQQQELRGGRVTAKGRGVLRAVSRVRGCRGAVIAAVRRRLGVQNTEMKVSTRPNPVVTETPSVVHVTPFSPLLFDALALQNFTLAEALIDENTGLQYVSNADSQNTVLHAAVLHNAPTHLIEKLIPKGANLNARNELGRTPVYIAARHNVRAATMRVLVAAGGDINMRDNYSYTPLMAAAYNGASVSLVGVLVSLGAEVGSRDKMERTASDWANESHHSQISNFLDNFPLAPVLCSVYVGRLGRKSLLKILPPELMRMVWETLVCSKPNRSS